MNQNEPIAVLLSDVHFSLQNLHLARRSLDAALGAANCFDLPLIICGDLHDTKAALRAECVDAILELLDCAQTPVYVLNGNHDSINEKSGQSALGFLRRKANLITSPVTLDIEGQPIYFIPYQSSPEAFIEHASKIPPGSLVIAHQGFQGAAMGDYLVDHSSVPLEAVKHVRVISGHYHRNQTVGTVEYVGNPFTISYAEANDGPKGYKILYADGSTKLYPLRLRKHVIVERAPDTILEPIDRTPGEPIRTDDLLWIKVTGKASELSVLDKDEIGKKHLGHSNFRLDKIPTDTEVKYQEINHMQDSEILGQLIETIDESTQVKADLIDLTRKLLKP